MSVDTIIIIAISAATLVATALGIVWGYKWHKAGLRQNLEIELAGIERELADVDVQIERANADWQERNSKIFSIQQMISTPGEITALKSKRQALLIRKAEIKKQLNRYI